MTRKRKIDPEMVAAEWTRNDTSAIRTLIKEARLPAIRAALALNPFVPFEFKDIGSTC